MYLSSKRDNKNSELGYFESDNKDYHEENHDIFIDDIELNPRYKHISTEVGVQTQPYRDNNKPTLIHSMPNIIYDQEEPYNSLPPQAQQHIQSYVNNTYVNPNSVASSRLGFTNVPLRHMDDPNSPMPEAWIVYPKGANPTERTLGVQSRNVESILSVPRSYTAKPINFANSIGSRLKQSFVNINSLQRDTPVEQFINSDRENLVSAEAPVSEEERRKKRQRSSLVYGAGACCGLILLIAIVVGIALLAMYLGPGMPFVLIESI